MAPPSRAEPQSVVAVQTGNRMTVAVLRSQSLRDTLVAIDGELSSATGDTRFTGVVRGRSGTVVYRVTP